jgi:hypothetical protein
MDRYQELEESSRHWTPPKGLAGSTPRQVRLAPLGFGLMTVAGLLLAGSVALAVGLANKALNQADESRQLYQQGRITEARVTRHWLDRSKDRHPMVDYEFEWEGRSYTGAARVPLHLWRKMDVGSPFPVRFIPSHPARNRARDWGNSDLPLWLPFVLGAFLAGLGALLIFLLRRQMYLLREGRAALGLVTRYSQATEGKKHVHYEFRLLSGGIVKGRSGPTHRVPAIGSKVCVIYDRDNPGRHALYPMDLIKLA